MKKTLCIVITLVLTLTITACGQIGNDVTHSSASSSQSNSNNKNANKSVGNTPITLTIGDTILEAYLNDSAAAQSLISQLPLTVTLNDSDNDFCGDNLDIEYSESDVTTGYKNGDLAFWTPANNFVIFVTGEKNSANTGDLVKLGRITSSQEMLDTLEGQLDVTIALKEQNDVSKKSTTDTQKEKEEIKIKITVGDTELYSAFEDNATTRALIKEMPMTLPMSDLYDREMCYRYGAGKFSTDQLRSDGYEVGDIVYWPPRGSLVILYKQNGEKFERQHLGHIDSGVEVFATTGDTDVTFEVVD